MLVQLDALHTCGVKNLSAVPPGFRLCLFMAVVDFQIIFALYFGTLFPCESI